jgi:hypothetical protein
VHPGLLFSSPVREGEGESDAKQDKQQKETRSFLSSSLSVSRKRKAMPAPFFSFAEQECGRSMRAAVHTSTHTQTKNQSHPNCAFMMWFLLMCFSLSLLPFCFLSPLFFPFCFGFPLRNKNAINNINMRHTAIIHSSQSPHDARINVPHASTSPQTPTYTTQWPRESAPLMPRAARSARRRCCATTSAASPAAPFAAWPAVVA